MIGIVIHIKYYVMDMDKINKKIYKKKINYLMKYDMQKLNRI